MLNTCREDIHRFLSRRAFEDTPSIVSSLSQQLPGTSNPQIPTITNKVPASSVAPPDIDGVSVASGLPKA